MKYSMPVSQDCTDSPRLIKILFFALLVFLFLVPVGSFAQKIFDFNNNCQQAYKEIIWLKLKSGQEILNNEKKINPDNLIPYFLENYIDFFVLFLNQDPAEYKLRKENAEKRLQLMKTGPVSSPFYLFTRSVIHFQWAAVHVKF